MNPSSKALPSHHSPKKRQCMRWVNTPPPTLQVGRWRWAYVGGTFVWHLAGNLGKPQTALSNPSSRQSPLSSRELRSHGERSPLPAGRHQACWDGWRGYSQGWRVWGTKESAFPSPSWAQLLASLPSELSVSARKDKLCVKGKTASRINEQCIFHAMITSPKMWSGSGLLSFFTCFCSWGPPMAESETAVKTSSSISDLSTPRCSFRGLGPTVTVGLSVHETTFHFNASLSQCLLSVNFVGRAQKLRSQHGAGQGEKEQLSTPIK